MASGIYASAVSTAQAEWLSTGSYEFPPSLANPALGVSIGYGGFLTEAQLDDILDLRNENIIADQYTHNSNAYVRQVHDNSIYNANRIGGFQINPINNDIFSYPAPGWNFTERFQDLPYELVNPAPFSSPIPTPRPGCFHPNTAISMADGSKKPIKDIRVGDLVTSYDDKGKLVAGRVTRTMDNTVKFILDVHGLLVTPGHVTLCGDGRFDGQHVPMIDILRSGGALVKEDGTKVRAGTDEPVGAPRDQLIHAVAGDHDQDGNFIPRESGKIRLGTKYLTEDEEGDTYIMCVADIIEHLGGIVLPNGMIAREPGGEGMPHLWSEGPRLPRPEDYVLQRSQLTLNDIYAAGEWEAVQPQMPSPPSAEAMPVKGPEGLIARSANASGALARQSLSPGKPMTRQQRRAAQAKERKAAKARKRMVHS